MCLCSEYNLRSTSIFIGIVTTINYFVQLTMVVLNQDYLVKEFSNEQYQAFVFNHAVLMLICLSMLFGAIFESKWLLLPFIIFISFQCLISLLMVFLSIQSMFNSPETTTNGLLALCLVSIVNFTLTFWSLVMTVKYFRLLYSGYKEPRVLKEWSIAGVNEPLLHNP